MSMSKKVRPSLKDYLRTGEVRAELFESREELPSESEAPSSQKKQKKISSPSKPVSKSATEKKNGIKKRAVQVGKAPDRKASSKANDSPGAAENSPSFAISAAAEFFLDSLAATDRETWDPILRAGSEIAEFPLDYAAVREDFRTMDRNRFTCYILDQKGAALRPIRTSVQIRGPLELLAKWDELGMLTLYLPASSASP